MRFRLYHLFAATALVCMILFVIDKAMYETVLVELEPPIVWNEESDSLTFGEVDYGVSFEVQTTAKPLKGAVFGEFGYNSLYRRDINPENISMVGTRNFWLKCRKRSFLWLPATSPEDELESHFSTLMIFPDPEEWRRKAGPR